MTIKTTDVVSALFIAGAITAPIFFATSANSQTLQPLDLNRFQPAECISCLTDPANDQPANRGHVYDVRQRTDVNAEHIAVMNQPTVKQAPPPKPLAG